MWPPWVELSIGNPVSAVSMLAQSRLWLVQGVWLLLAILFWLGVLSLLMLALWVLIRWLIWRGRVRAAWAKAEAARRRVDGSLYPPTDEGLCDRCGLVFQAVHFLSDGRRLCRGCYDHVVPLDTRAHTAAKSKSATPHRREPV